MELFYKTASKCRNKSLALEYSIERTNVFSQVYWNNLCCKSINKPNCCTWF